MLIEFLDQVRDMWLQAYGDDITSMLRQAMVAQALWDLLGEEEPF